jgi:hypothetical protein
MTSIASYIDNMIDEQEDPGASNSAADAPPISLYRSSGRRVKPTKKAFDSQGVPKPPPRNRGRKRARPISGANVDHHSNLRNRTTSTLCCADQVAFSRILMPGHSRLMYSENTIPIQYGRQLFCRCQRWEDSIQPSLPGQIWGC